MPRTCFDLNLLANMVAKLGKIVGKHVKFDMFANNIKFGHTFRNFEWAEMLKNNYARRKAMQTTSSSVANQLL